MKQFTSILFCLILVLGLQIDKVFAVGDIGLCEAKKTVSQCRTCCISEFPAQKSTTIVNGATSETSSAAVGYSECLSSCSDMKSGANETKSECSTAMEKYEKAMAANPCPAGSSEKACLEQIASCQDSMSVTSSQSLATGDENIDSIANSALEMIKATQASKQNSTTTPNVNLACYTALQVTDKEAAKERKSRQDQIIKDIEAADKERREANEKLAKETNETKIDQQKLQAETKKTIQKLDVEKREKLTKMNEDLQKAGTDIRKQTTDIIKIKQAMEKLKFENQKTMMAYTEEKINQQCKSALETAKVCFVKASKGVKFTEKDTCSNFTFTGKGTKGTAELKKKLKQVKEACFEQSNQTVSTLKYEYADKVRTYEMDIKEKQEQIADANKALEAKKLENEAINKETEAQKSQEQKSLEEQMTNFAEKLANLEKSTNAAVKSSEDKIARLNLELNDLKAGALANETADPGSKSVYDNITKNQNAAVMAASRAAKNAHAACCDGKSAKAGAGAIADCNVLYTDPTKIEKKSKQKVKDKTNQ